MKIGIVGHEAAKFTAAGQERARQLIRQLLAHQDSILVSGRCHLGGIDIWAEEEADALQRKMLIFPPRVRAWEGGYKDRNLQIAREGDVLHSIVVDRYPPGFEGMRFDLCYHCNTNAHIKSGGCWTVKQGRRFGKPGFVHVIENT